jgi:hypothetical protein
VTPATTGPQLAVWLDTQLQPDGEYVLTMSIGDDYAVELPVDQALAHAVEVLRNVALADYAQAIRQQMLGLGTDPEGVEDLLRALVPRLPMSEPVTELVMLPAINRNNGEPMLQIAFRDQLLGVWTLKEARSHALGVLEATLAARMDTSYRQALIENIDLDGATAAGVINALGKLRWPL